MSISSSEFGFHYRIGGIFERLVRLGSTMTDDGVPHGLSGELRHAVMDDTRGYGLQFMRAAQFLGMWEEAGYRYIALPFNLYRKGEEKQRLFDAAALIDRAIRENKAVTPEDSLIVFDAR